MNLSVQQYRSLGKRANKYGAKKVEADGIKFDSVKERNRYLELRRLQDAGQISHLELQPAFKLYCGDQPILIRSDRYRKGRHATYRADFAYFDGTHRVIEDVKSKATRTEAYVIRKAIVEAMFPHIRVVEV